jgi:hypothetical protein
MFSDPTGKYPEELIMKFVGVGTWADVIKQFQVGGRFSGDWGWLETMRQAEDGDLFYAGIDGVMNGKKISPNYIGKFSSIYGETHRPNGQIGRGIFLFDEYHDSDLVNTDDMLHRTYWYQIKRQDGSIKFDTKAYQKYYHITFNPSKVNWIPFSLDTASVLASIIPGATASIQGVKFSNNMAKTTKIIAEVNGIYDFGTRTILLINGDINGTWLSIGAAFPGPVGGGFSIGCVYHDLENAVLITP